MSWPLIQVELAAAKESAAEAPPEPPAMAAKKTGVSREQQLRSVEKFPEELRQMLCGALHLKAQSVVEQVLSTVVVCPAYGRVIALQSFCQWRTPSSQLSWWWWGGGREMLTTADVVLCGGSAVWTVNDSYTPNTDDRPHTTDYSPRIPAFSFARNLMAWLIFMPTPASMYSTCSSLM